MQIIPALLEKTTTDLVGTIQKLSPFYKRFQIDIEDGVFIPFKSLEIGQIINDVERKAWKMEDLSFDFHLMVKNYENEIKDLDKLRKFLPIKNVLIHYSQLPNLQQLTDKYTFPIGLVLNPEDQIDDLVKHYDLNNIPFIQIMSIHPGPQGQSFIPETLNKIDQLRSLSYRSEIYLDGAINDKSIPLILSRKFLPDFLCIGSFLTKTNKLGYRIKYLSSAIQTH